MYKYLFSILFTQAISQWITIEPESDSPAPRFGHSLNKYEDFLLLFGGWDNDSICYNDLYKYFPHNSTWVAIHIEGDKPLARQGHTATRISNLLYIIAGKTSSNRLEDVWALDLDEMSWKEIFIGGNFDAISYHSAASTEAGNIIIFGGRTNDDLTNVVTILDIQQKKWGHPILTGNKPNARQGQVMQRIEDRYYVFGGYSHLGALNDLYILDYKQLRWQKMDSEGVLPNKRENMGSSVYGKTFYIAGGCDPNHYICYEDTHKFNTTTSEWSLLDESSLEPKGDFAMEIQEGIMYSFGGAFFLESVYNSIKSQDTEDPCPEQCSGNGTCVNDVCECDGGWTGDACDQEAHCEYDCFDRGLCYDQVCECFPGYSGPHCSEVVYCPFNCTSTDNGVCQDNGECDCSGDWTGEDCNQLTPQAQCRENCKHGDCDTEGKCVCWAGYIGSNCDLHMPETATQTESKHEAPKEESTVRHRSDGGQKTVEPEPEQDETAGPTLSTDAKMSFGEAQEYNHALTPEMFGLSFPVVDDEPADNLRTDLDLPDDKDMSEEQEASEDKLEDMDAMLQECELMCSHHGLCIDSTCYCEEGYTGEICEKKESELSEGHPMSLAMMLGGIGFALSFIVGFWITRNLSKAIAAREQAQVEAEDSDD